MQITEFDWNYSSLLPESDFVHEQEIRKQKITAFIQKYKNDEKYYEDPKALLLALQDYDALAAEYLGGNDLYYYQLRSYIDQSDTDIKATLNKIVDDMIALENELTFFELQIAHIPVEKQKIFLSSPELKPYYHLIERGFEKAKHYLSEAEEKIMALKSKTAYAEWVEMTQRFLTAEERTFIVHGKEKKQPFTQIIGLMDDPDKKTRDNAARAFNDILDTYTQVAEVEMNAVLHDKKINDELRGFTTPDASRILGDNMDRQTVHMLIERVSHTFTIPREYYAFKAKLLHIPQLSYHERNLPYSAVSKSYSIDDAFTLVYNELQNLHPSFGKIMKQFMENGAYDIFPKKGKYSGAFCIHMLPKQPTYILLNYTNKLTDVLTIAHETGHGINYELTKQKQTALNFGVYTSTAEVASTFMEDVILDKLVEEADDELKLSLYVQKLNNEVSTIFRQAAFFQFETDLHMAFREKGYLTHEDIGKLFSKHMISYMGDAVEQSPGSQNWWMYVSHFRNYFYTYTYVSGLLISKALRFMVKEDKRNIEKVITFFEAGTSKSPLQLFLDMGIDIRKESFWDNGLAEVRKTLDDAIDLATKLGKL